MTGAAGIIGMEAIARATPDGYTLGMGNAATLALNPHLYQKLPYDVRRDYIPISLAAIIRNYRGQQRAPRQGDTRRGNQGRVTSAGDAVRK